MFRGFACNGPATRVLKLGVIGSRGLGSIQGGIEHYCSEFYTKLYPYGFDTTVFVRRAVMPEELPVGIRTVFIPAPRLRSFETIFHSFTSILVAWSLGIATIHVHGIGPCLVLPLARILGMRTIVRHVGADYSREKWGVMAKILLRLGERCAARYAHSIVCLHHEMASEFSRATGRKHRVFVIPNGVDAPQRQPVPFHDTPFGVASGRYILAVGRLVPEKNFHLLLLAFLRAQLPQDVKLLIAGEADYDGKYGRAFLRACAKSRRVVTLGAVFGSQLDALYQHAGLFVLPSSHEGMSFALLRAGIAGVKIIASDIPGNSIVCRDFARLVAVDSTEALRQAIELEWNRERLPSEIEQQIGICKSRHDWSAIAQQMIPILSSLRPSRSESIAIVATNNHQGSP
jgi:glycosyltransferase involved in cell wall biosynthesis